MKEKIFNDNLILESKNSKNNDRIINYIATKESVLNDSGRLFEVKGMDLSYLKKFKSIYFNHNTNDIPIGKAVSVRKNGDEVRIAVQFAEATENSFADTIFRMIKNGYINGGSIGVTADYKDIEYPEKPKKIGGKQVSMIIHKSELKEFSITPRPDNRAAVPLNASLDKAMKDGVIDEDEAEKFKEICAKTEQTDNEINSNSEENPEQTNTNTSDDIVALKARIEELELLLAEEKMEEETKDSVYDELYDEFMTDKEDNTDNKDSWMDEFLK